MLIVIPGLLKIGVKILKINTVLIYFSRGRNLNETSELSFPARLSLLKRDYNRSLRSQTKMSKKQIPFNILREFWGKIYTSHNFTLETHECLEEKNSTNIFLRKLMHLSLISSFVIYKFLGRSLTMDSFGNLICKYSFTLICKTGN